MLHSSNRRRPSSAQGFHCCASPAAARGRRGRATSSSSPLFPLRRSSRFRTRPSVGALPGRPKAEAVLRPVAPALEGRVDVPNARPESRGYDDEQAAAHLLVYRLDEISPSPTCTTMFRAISEIAVAISVVSVFEKPSRSASRRACARAGTMSASTSTRPERHRPWAATPRSGCPGAVAPVQVECRVEGREIQLEMHHRDCDVGLDADDDGLGATELRSQRDRP